MEWGCRDKLNGSGRTETMDAWAFVLDTPPMLHLTLLHSHLKPSKLKMVPEETPVIVGKLRLNWGLPQTRQHPEK